MSSNVSQCVLMYPVKTRRLPVTYLVLLPRVLSKRLVKLLFSNMSALKHHHIVFCFFLSFLKWTPDCCGSLSALWSVQWKLWCCPFDSPSQQLSHSVFVAELSPLSEYLRVFDILCWFYNFHGGKTCFLSSSVYSLSVQHGEPLKTHLDDGGKLKLSMVTRLLK